MKQTQIQQLRKSLEKELERLQQYVNEEPTAEITEVSSVDNHPADAATDLTTIVTEQTLNELREDEIEKIRFALNAMDEGAYGQCNVCGKDIPFERLEAIPTALTCIDHVEEYVE